MATFDSKEVLAKGRQIEELYDDGGYLL